jgi:transcriptional regulator with XRE-family HTH domain
MDCGQILKQIREQHKLSQTDLARLLNLTRYSISDIEAGRSTIRLEYLITLSNHFNLSVDYLIGNTRYAERHPDINAMLDKLNPSNMILAKQLIQTLLNHQTSN